ncbi:MAG: TraB/GumN family protein, partial [Muribaculaceae bacterium]|nr:TraB/GumN family protein [Muribaculaceae bacterium]
MKKICLSAVFMLMAVCACAQLLWRIEAPGARPSYLFGTCHFLDVDYAASIPGLDSAFLACDTLYTEIGIPDAAAVQTSVMELSQRLMEQ